MLDEVVRAGTATAAKIDGYTVAGKTGTARKPLDGGKGYREGAYVATFAGFVPAEQPRLSAIVVLDEPTPIYGGLVSAPVFADVARYGLRLFKVPPPVAAPIVAVPAVTAAGQSDDAPTPPGPTTTAPAVAATKPTTLAPSPTSRP